MVLKCINPNAETGIFLENKGNNIAADALAAGDRYHGTEYKG